MNRRTGRKGADGSNRAERSGASHKRGKQMKEPTNEEMPRRSEDSGAYSQTGERLPKAVPKTMASPFRSTLLKSDVKSLVTRLTGVGHLVIPKDIKFQKWLISSCLSIMFMFSSIANGVIIYGIESAIEDKCYSPFTQKTWVVDKPKAYRCPSFNGQWIRPDHAMVIRAFELGSTLHTIAIGVASSAAYYLNVGLIVIYVMLFLAGLTMMLISILIEVLTYRIGVLVYFNIAPPYIVGFLIYFLLDVLELFATINLQVRWINFLM